MLTNDDVRRVWDGLEAILDGLGPDGDKELAPRGTLDALRECWDLEMPLKLRERIHAIIDAAKEGEQACPTGNTP